MRIHVSASSLDASATHLRTSAGTLGSTNSALLLLFYCVECSMKARYISAILKDPRMNTADIPPSAFGSSGHDLDAGRKALKVPASVPAAPNLRVDGQSHAVQFSHQVWRYGILHEGSPEMEAWFGKMIKWLEDSR